ncbi:Sensitive to high expression protein 9-like, mitochondrial [Porphyridium purpureum]|uniref:Sensitive to high expression protein 9-like, mitochondrial n=1 Tax=Porphyridium purpureum TaxID=35688 RepID=A0A5J4YIH1_PORPP|nr:Sensitive to high expression protein 9-like, mitochondrial [Porphyridium purpureum]|eukprot:POR8739..scf289_17
MWQRLRSIITAKAAVPSGHALADISRRARARASNSVARWAVRLSRLMNKVSGFERITQLRRRVEASRDTFLEVRQKSKAAKAAYERAVGERSVAQTRLSSLLQSKHEWGDAQVDAFTQLCREEHALAAEEAAQKSALHKLEAREDTAFSALMDSARDRYHEEALYSDKIAALSTYVTIAIVCFNSALFAASVFLVEPRRRRILQAELEVRLHEKQHEVLLQTQSAIQALRGQIKEDMVASVERAVDNGVSRALEERVALFANAFVADALMDPTYRQASASAIPRSMNDSFDGELLVTPPLSPSQQQQQQQQQQRPQTQEKQQPYQGLVPDEDLYEESTASFADFGRAVFELPTSTMLALSTVVGVGLGLFLR